MAAMTDDPILSDAERRLFRGAVVGATPLGGEPGRPGQRGKRPAAAKPAVDATDHELFRQAMIGTTPLRVDRVPHYHRRLPPLPRPARHEREAVRIEMVSDGFEPTEREAGEELWFAHPGLQQSVLRKLRRGRVTIGAELDLHGMIVAEAHQAVGGFIREAQQRNIRCVRIIHGKGHGSLHRYPVLKTKVDHWLRQCDGVLAFSSARPADGGAGALYVLLKRL